MEDLPSLTTNRKLKEEVESWIMEQDEKKSAAEAAEQFPDLKNYASRSVIKIVGNASKAAEKIRDAMSGKRSASMMEAARSGAVLAKKQATDIDRDIISPPINTRRGMITPSPFSMVSGDALYDPEEIRLDCYYTQWRFNVHHDGTDVEQRLGLSIGANALVYGDELPSVQVVHDGTILEIKVKLPDSRNVGKYDTIYESEINSIMESRVMSPTTLVEEKKAAINEISDLRGRKICQMDAVTEDQTRRKALFDYGVFRVELLETCEVRIPKKKVKGTYEQGKILDIDLIVKREKTYKGSEAVEASPSKVTA